jgi:hypothetical protein
MKKGIAARPASMSITTEPRMMNNVFRFMVFSAPV